MLCPDQWTSRLTSYVFSLVGLVFARMKKSFKLTECIRSTDTRTFALLIIQMCWGGPAEGSLCICPDIMEETYSVGAPGQTLIRSPAYSVASRRCSSTSWERCAWLGGIEAGSRSRDKGTTLRLLYELQHVRRVQVCPGRSQGNGPESDFARVKQRGDWT